MDAPVLRMLMAVFSPARWNRRARRTGLADGEGLPLGKSDGYQHRADEGGAQRGPGARPEMTTPVGEALRRSGHVATLAYRAPLDITQQG